MSVKLVRDTDAGNPRRDRGGRWLTMLSYPLTVPKRRRRGQETGVDVGLDAYAVDQAAAGGTN